ncbi:hypothetical protein GA0116948_1328 [Chitinophaga costaii]|uniref:Uncharacterized protein n=1 Tax=Chitinophaga costaii TaxID=1335309 RepID=A0A1C4G8G3_9BACT|nr:hypothetical protein [Chitinophaga costaii]PUZ19486.1 hypothetical protein DCM91_20515 [Chitinophaga costaii]SCC64480.1 hypothetical protein GA0116948_1328 [Chitinophaga costaii]
MKQKVSLILFYVFLLLNIIACNGQQSSMKKNNNFDSAFKYNYTILDSIAKTIFFDTSATCKNAIEFMEKTTAIKASKDGNYFGAILFTQKDLDKWKKWYDKNKKK